MPVEEFINVGILTVSDRCFAKEAIDKSGDDLEAIIKSGTSLRGNVTTRKCVPDEKNIISEILKEWCSGDIDIIFTTGGTGFSPRDVTPEATKSVIEREAPGLTHAMLKKSLDITPMAMLTRLMCGIRGETIIVNLPGSTKASRECFLSIAQCLGHAVDVVRNRKEKIEATHVGMHGCARRCCDDVDRVARRPRDSPYPLKSVTEAQDIIWNECQSLGIEVVDFMDAVGRVLSEDVRAQDPLPPFPASIKDGYAVVASDGAGKRKVIGDSTAGVQPGKVSISPGVCVRISTGAPVPPGADAVVQVEDTKLIKEDLDGRAELEIEILKAPKSGQEIRPIGCDIALNEKVLSRGTQIGPAEVGMLATVGVTDVKTFKLPTVGVLSTGNEVQEPAGPLVEGHIRDSNRPTLLSLLRAENIPTVDLGISLDTIESLSEKFELGLSSCDVIVTTGGASMGERDLLKAILTRFNASILFGRVFMKPGKPTIFATCVYNGSKKLIFGLPGNPVSGTVTSHLYVLPACRKIAGKTNFMYTTVRAKITTDLDLDPRPEYHRVSLSWIPGQALPSAVSTGNQISSRLTSFNSANAMLTLPPRTKDQTCVRKGEEISAIIIQKL